MYILSEDAKPIYTSSPPPGTSNCPKTESVNKDMLIWHSTVDGYVSVRGWFIQELCQVNLTGDNFNKKAAKLKIPQFSSSGPGPRSISNL